MMKFNKLIIEQNNGEFTVDILYIPNDFVGEVSKRVFTTKNIHDLWMKLKEIFEHGNI